MRIIADAFLKKVICAGVKAERCGFNPAKMYSAKLIAEAAIGAEKPTKRLVHPVRNPSTG